MSIIKMIILHGVAIILVFVLYTTYLQGMLYRKFDSNNNIIDIDSSNFLTEISDINKAKLVVGIYKRGDKSPLYLYAFYKDRLLKSFRGGRYSEILQIENTDKCFSNIKYAKKQYISSKRYTYLINLANTVYHNDFSGSTVVSDVLLCKVFYKGEQYEFSVTQSNSTISKAFKAIYEDIEQNSVLPKNDF